jgi:phytanoyl-CoA hydroxylase
MENQSDQVDSLRADYQKNGYCVVPGLIPANKVDALLDHFSKVIAPCSDLFFRQSTNRYEANRKTEHGYVIQSFLDIHDYQKHPEFSRLALEIYASTEMLGALAQITGSAKHHLMQSMFFDANTATSPHQDCWYLDTVPNHNLVAAWIALEDIQEQAGRFYVVSGSQNVNLHSDTPGLPQKVWLQRCRKYFEDHAQEVHAPALKKGDVLFWNSWTIHGALPTKDPSYSRKSLTAHYIPAEYSFGNIFTKKDYVQMKSWRDIQYFKNQPDYTPFNQAKARFKTWVYDSPKTLAVLRKFQRTLGHLVGK